MILITDGGSTKCDWILIDLQGQVVLKTRTEGINPAIVPAEEILRRIESNMELQLCKTQVTVLDFYGAGCGTPTPVKKLTTILENFFTNAHVTVQEDTVAAVRAATNQPGIVCIFGTGSNCCYFDGNKIYINIDSLGYMLMDEASGNYFGRRLIRDYFYKKMPEELALRFQQLYDLNSDTIKINLYQKPNPNAYLASFAEFIFSQEQINTYFYKVLQEGIEEFIQCRILSYPESKYLPIHFVGSIAYFSQSVIADCLAAHQLKLGQIIHRPIDQLITYYQTHKTNTV